MSVASAQAKREIMSAVSVLQKFAKTGKVGAAEPMDAKRKRKPAAKKQSGGKPKKAGGSKPKKTTTKKGKK